MQVIFRYLENRTKKVVKFLGKLSNQNTELFRKSLVIYQKANNTGTHKN